MTAKRNAYALRRYSVDGETVAARSVILGMVRGQFESFELAGMVREATDAEVAREKGDTPSNSTSRKRTSARGSGNTTRRTATAPAPAPAAPAAATGADTPTT